MFATTTQLLSSGEFCKLRYDTRPVKSASANISFYTKNSKSAKFWVVTLLSQMRDMFVPAHKTTLPRAQGSHNLMIPFPDLI
jgi:hypothetical protein